jgi:hypothetical protein
MADVKSEIAAIIAKHQAIPIVNIPKDVLIAGEILSERKESMKVFDAGKGQRTAHIYACPIHFKDTDGTFKTIDPTVKRKPLLDPLQTHKYEVKSGTYHAHFKADKPHDYRLEIGDSWIEYEALFDESESLTIKVDTSKIGIKETIALKDKNAPTKLSWIVTRSGNGIITPPPTAHDAKGKNVPVIVTQDKDILTYEVDTTDAIFPIEIDPTSITATNDGYVYKSNSFGDYAAARDSIAGDAKDTTNFAIGQSYVDQDPDFIYTARRAFASLLIPDMSEALTASLFLYGKSDSSTVDFLLYIHTSTYSTPLVKEDYDLFDGHQASGAYNGTVLNNIWASSGYSATWNEITFNASGLAAILAKKNDTLKLALISKEDYDNSAPTDNEFCNFYTSSESGKEPYLSITYTIAVVEEVSALIEMEAEVTTKWEAITSVSALIEVEVSATENTWSYRKSLIVNAAAIDSPLSDFPCGIVLNSGNFDFTKARSDGYDIRFINSTGTSFLPYERVSHDAVNKLAEYHFKASSLTDSSIYYMLYGNASATDGADPEAVWDDNFVMVQHMNDGVDNAHITDSTQYDNDGAKKGANEPVEATGQIGMAQDFDGSNDYIGMTNLRPAGNAFTFSFWAKSSSAGVQKALFSLSDNPEAHRFDLWWEYAAGGNLAYNNGGATSSFGAHPVDGLWHYYELVADNTSLKLYVDNVQSGATKTITALDFSASANFKIGSRYDGSAQWFPGSVDEFRISETARSAAWIKAEYYLGNGTLFTLSDGDIVETISSLIEVEASIQNKITSPISSLIEVEASIISTKTQFLTLSGSMTPSGGISLSNPDWIPIDDRLNWMGEWNATYVYTVGDVVMYKTDEGRYHGWLSRTTHNVGNIPTTAYAHWARIIQAKWKR